MSWKNCEKQVHKTHSRIKVLYVLTLKAPITTKVVCFSRLLKCLRCLYVKQCGPRSDCSYRSICSGSMLFASILNLSVMLDNYLQQTTSANNIFRCIFFLGALRVKYISPTKPIKPNIAFVNFANNLLLPWTL